MRMLKYLLACVFVPAGSSMAGSAERLFGIGTFAYGAPSTASPALIVAANEK